MAKRKDHTFKIIIGAIVIVILFSMTMCTVLIADFDSTSGNVAVIPIHGVIMSNGGMNVAASDQIVAWIEDAAEDSSVKGVVLEINSPGGSAVASDEIGQALKQLDKPTVAWIREVGASGGYWIASATNYTVANRMSVTGSIGVIGSYFGFDEFIDDWNVSYRRFVSGERKDIGTPFRAMDEDERAFLQAKVDMIHEIFVDEVALNRNLDRSYVSSLATGEYYLGVEALELQLIDALGGLDEALAYIEVEAEITADPFWYENDVSWTDILFGMRAVNPFDMMEQDQYYTLR